MKRTTTITETFCCTSRSERERALRLEEMRRANARVVRELHRLRESFHFEKDAKRYGFIFDSEGSTKCPRCKMRHTYSPHLMLTETFRCYGCGYAGLAHQS